MMTPPNFFLVAGFCLGLCLPGGAQADAPQPRVLTVTGHGEAAATPDLAILSFGAVLREGDARMAVEQVAKVMNAVMAALREAGVDARDLQTETLSLNPVYQHFNDNRPPALIAYEARNRVTARLRDISAVGDAVDLASRAGATEFGGVRFGFAEPGPLRDAALRAAVADAARKARLVAEAAGVALGAPQQVSIGNSGGPRPVAYKDMTLMRAEASPMPVAAGESTVDARVSITYALD